MFTGPFIFGVAPKWALSNNFMQWDYIQELVAHGGVPDVYNLRHKEENISVSDLDLTYVNQFINFIQSTKNKKIADSDIQKGTVDKCLSEFLEPVLKNHKESYSTCHSDDSKIKPSNLLDTNQTIDTYLFCKDKSENLSETKEKIDHHHKIIDCVPCLSQQSNIQNITQYKTLSKILEQYKNIYNLYASEEDKPLNLVKNLEDNKGCCNKQSEDKKKLCNFTDIKVSLKDCAISDRTNHSCNIENCYNTKYKEIDYGLLKFSDLDDLSPKLKIDKTLLKASKSKLCKNLETKLNCVPNKYLEQESTLALNKYLSNKTSVFLREKKNTNVSFINSPLNVKDTSIKSESCSDEQINKSKNSYFVNTCKPTLSNWEDFEMSGQYPGHSRPPVGTPPPQTVWNHLTMAQSQGNNSLQFFGKFKKKEYHF